MTPQYDAVVVGAGFSGLYMTHLLKQRGASVLGIERGKDVGGTWYWNRYPGCRCDVESMDYSYGFSEELEQQWEWSERYSPQPEILSYANHVADRFALREHFLFGVEVSRATFDDESHSWSVHTSDEQIFSCRFLIMATGCLSAANVPQFEGLDSFAGETYHTGAWPQQGVDFHGADVAVIGTGSSAIQSIPLIAKQARSLTVFQRTPNYSIPAQNGPIDPDMVARTKANYREIRARNYAQPAAFGQHYPRNTDSVLDATPEERERRFEEYWQHGGFMFLGAFGDITMNMEANAIAAEFVRSKIRAIVHDSATAERLCPDTVLGCKRLCADTGYFETYNRDNVHLVDISEHGIERLTVDGLVANGKPYQFDRIVFATGFDAMTGALLKIDITGRDGARLKDKWAAGPRTYLGLAMHGFPNLFTMTGPGSPSVLANMITGAEQHAEYIDRLTAWMAQNGHTQIEAERDAEDAWVQVVNDRSELTLYPRCNSWYLGANVPGKPRVFMPYIGFPDYTEVLQSVADKGYEGFSKA